MDKDLSALAEKAEKFARIEAETEFDAREQMKEEKFAKNTTVITIEDGIPKVMLGLDLEREEKRRNWLYRMKTADGRFTIVDYDKDKIRPYVKSLLAKVNRLLEVKLLWFVILEMLLIFVFAIVLWAFLMSQIRNVEDSQAKILEAISKISVPAPKVPAALPDSGGVPEAFPEAENSKPSAPQNRLFPVTP